MYFISITFGCATSTLCISKIDFPNFMCSPMMISILRLETKIYIRCLCFFRLVLGQNRMGIEIKEIGVIFANYHIS